jgi:hypothetical protein
MNVAERNLKLIPTKKRPDNSRRNETDAATGYNHAEDLVKLWRPFVHHVKTPFLLRQTIIRAEQQNIALGSKKTKQAEREVNLKLLIQSGLGVALTPTTLGRQYPFDQTIPLPD